MPIGWANKKVKMLEFVGNNYDFLTNTLNFPKFQDQHKIFRI